jgi:hypothetical protein
MRALGGQLAKAAAYQVRLDMFFRWPYQAKVMNTLLQPSRTAVR